MDKYENKRIEMYDLALNLIKTCTSNILLNINGEEQQFQLQIIKKHVECYCHLDIEHENHKSIMNLTRNKYSLEPELNNNVVTVYDKLCNEHSFPEVNVDTHKFMQQFKKNSKNDIVEDFLMSDSFIIPIDPITKNAISNPVKNIHCGHIYESDTIKHLMKNKKIKCPYVGCRAIKYITFSDLHEDIELKQKIENISKNI